MAKRQPAATARRKPTRKSSGGSRKRVVARTAASRKAGARKAAPAAKKIAKKIAKKTAKTSAKAAKKRAPKAAPKRVASKAAPKRVVKAAARKPAAKRAVPKKAARPVARKISAAPSRGVPARKVPNLDRARRTVVDDDIVQQTPPSSLNLDRTASSARTGRRELLERLGEHNETSPAMTAGDVDADWEGAYSSGDEAPGGDNPTPDQDVVDEIGKAVGVQYEDNEELKGEEKITKRDKHRWELDPASAEDYKDH
jgi:hypothetical protein